MADLNGLTVEQYLLDSVEIEPLAIQEEYVRIPSDLAYWNQKYADAMRDFLIAKIDCERTEARLCIELREKLLLEGKTTESMIEAAVTKDERMHVARLELVAAETEKVRLYGVIDAVRTKRDMLVSIGAHLRAELQGDPSIRAQHQNERIRQSNDR